MNEVAVASTENRAWSWSNLLAILTFVATAIMSVATVVESISPKWGGILVGIGAGILAFLGRVQGTPTK